MATGELRPDGNVLLQNRLRQVGDRMTLYGLAKGESGSIVPLTVSRENITWGAVGTNGVITTGVYTFGIGIPPNLPTGTDTWDESIVHGIVILNESNQELLSQSLGTSDDGFNKTGNQETFNFSDDGTSGKYTVSTTTVNFS